MKTVIIGGVAGGASCAARLRRLDEKAEIVVLERGEYISYANCGLPYHVGDVIKERGALLLQTPKAMKAKFNIDVRVKNEVISINRDRKTVTVRRNDTSDTYEEKYDKLVISTGSSPVRPPIPGIDSPRVHTLWTVPDTDELRNLIYEGKAQSAVVVGGGFIGLEMAENLRRAGLAVTIIEMNDQVMTTLDYEMAQLLHLNITENGVTLNLGDGVTEFSDDGNSVTVKTKNGRAVKADFVLLSIGVRPNSTLARAAGLELNARGGIVVNDHMLSSDPDIYAVGDVIEVEDYIFKDKTMIPLAGPANKQGRIAADNIAGIDSVYRGTQGSAVAKVFDLTAATTGANEKTLKKRGMVKGHDYETITISQNSHAGYYPGAVPMTIKLLFSADGKKIFGAEIVGRDGVDKRIDTIGTAIRFGAGVLDLKDLEFAYAPPYSSAKDPVNMAGFVAENLLTGKVRFSDWDAPGKLENSIVLDVREAAELAAYSLSDVVHIPLGQLRSRLGELDKSKTIIVLCAIGVRAYNAARILSQHGFGSVLVYPGGARFYQSTHYQADIQNPDDTPSATVAVENSPAAVKAEAVKTIRLDCNGLQCPGPIMKVFETMKTMNEGETVEISASDPGFVRDIDTWCRRTGNTLLQKCQRDECYIALVKKGVTKDVPVVRDTPDGKTIVVFSGDLDKVLASFIIANGAAAMGRKVTMFFTFWGLNILRKPKKVKVKKNFIEKMFGAMLPRGSGKLKLSKMNMGGMGTAMMKKIMNDKNVDSLEALIEKALKNGVKIIACTMSMDIMGIKKEELIDGIDFAGVGTYLGDAEESNVNLFI